MKNKMILTFSDRVDNGGGATAGAAAATWHGSYCCFVQHGMTQGS